MVPHFNDYQKILLPSVSFLDDSSGVPYLKVGFELEPFGTLDFGGIDKFLSGLELYVDNVLNYLTS
jgi:hypothetical protein